MGTVLAFLSNSIVTQIFAIVVGWFTAHKAAQDSQDTAVSVAEQNHLHDGAQSSVDAISSSTQNAALDQLEDQLDHPATVVITQPKGKA